MSPARCFDVRRALSWGKAARPGHRLRLAVQGFDVPHLAPPVAGGLKTLGPMRIYSGGTHPSSVTMPVRR